MSTPTNRSVQKAFSVLSSVAELGGHVSISALAQHAGMNVSTTHRLSRTLEHIGLLARDPTGGYRLGLALVELGATVDQQALLRTMARPSLRHMAQTQGMTAHLGVLDDNRMVRYLAKELPRRHFHIPTVVGCQLEAYCSSLGKVLLASLDPEVLDHYLNDGPLVPLTARTITYPDRLRDHLAGVRATGCAIDDEEVIEGLRCLAVPLRAPSGRVLAAISLSGTAEQMTPEVIITARHALERAALEIQRRLYPHGANSPGDGQRTQFA